MPRFGRRKIIWFAVGIIIVVIVAVCWSVYSNTPSPERTTHRIAARGFEQVIVSSKRSGVRTHRPPYRLEFESSAGAVDVYVVPVSLGYRAEDREHIRKVTDEFAAGQVPKDVVAKSSGDRGQIKLRGWWQGLWERNRLASYLVLIRSANESEVTLVVHYGP
jgi:hypothetical protein